MKKIILTAVVATMISLTAFADGGKKSTTEVGEQNVSYTVLTQFKSDFENASNVVWTVNSTAQKAAFTLNNVNYTAYYDSIGQYWGLAQNVAYPTVTSAIKKQIAKSYNGYDVKEVTRFEAQDGEEPVVYFINLKSATSEVILTIAPSDGQIKNIDIIK
ncbi:MAG: hypothetical protein V4560_06105 [Bacteroidota bacterium]